MRASCLKILWLVAGSLTLAGCGEDPKSVPGPKSIAARVFTAQYESVPALVQVPGSVQPRNRIVLSAQINGFVREVRVKAGDHVRGGQVLATLDSREPESQKAAAQAALDEAGAALDEARRSSQTASSMRDAARASAALANQTHERYQKLFEVRSVSPQELDEMRARRDGSAADLAAREAQVKAADDRVRQIQARIAQAGAQAKRADVLVSWTILKAPAAGTVVERMADPGSAIFPGSPLLAIESGGGPQVVADLPAAQRSALHPDLEVGVLLPGQSPLTVRGRVSEIIPVSNPQTHTVRFKVDLPRDFPAPSGTFAKVEIPAGSRRALLVPRQTVRETGQLTGVFVADASSIARFRLVKATEYDAGRLEILAGLEPGERIVADLSDRISDGTPLEIRP